MIKNERKYSKVPKMNRFSCESINSIFVFDSYRIEAIDAFECDGSSCHRILDKNISLSNRCGIM